MGLLKRFYPSEYLDSAYLIEYEKLFKEGKRGIIYDVDNTLVMHGYPPDERAIALFLRLHEIGYKVILLSNNKEMRVKTFAEGVKYCNGYIYKANKPSKKGYLKAMDIMGTDKDSTIFVGDQLFTDVWGANRTGIMTFLTKPINPKEEIQIVLKRYLEKIVLYFYRKDKDKSR